VPTIFQYEDPHAGKTPIQMAHYRLLYEKWSCEWRYWDYGRNVPYFSELWALDYGPGIEPLALLPQQSQPLFIFVVGGHYHWFDCGSMNRINAEFASHGDFLT
jgi:hypothetical protein